MSLTVLITEWLEQHAEKQGVAGSIPGACIHFRFEFFAYFPLLTVGRSLNTNKIKHGIQESVQRFRFNIK